MSLFFASPSPLIGVLLLSAVAAIRDQKVISSQHSGSEDVAWAFARRHSDTAATLDPEDPEEIVVRGQWKYDDAEANYDWLKPAIKECVEKYTYPSTNVKFCQQMAQCIRDACEKNWSGESTGHQVLVDAQETGNVAGFTSAMPFGDYGHLYLKYGKMAIVLFRYLK